MTDDRTPYLDDLADLQPGDPIPTPSLESQVDKLDQDSSAELIALHFRLLPGNGPPLTPEEDARRRRLWQWFAAGREG